MKDLIGIPPRTESPLGRAFRFLVILAFFTLVIGLIIDVFSGLPVTKGARSVMAWVAGILGIGALYIIGELGADWIHQKDRVSDPLLKRVLHLLALLAFVVIVVLCMITVVRMAT
ncbi:MAG TPA: hypothetical protein VGK99_08530 [Acidobacteriota bacterium]|jgi:hypothetical protein